MLFRSVSVFVPWIIQCNQRYMLFLLFVTGDANLYYIPDALILGEGRVCLEEYWQTLNET